MDNVGISSIATYLPERRIDNLTRGSDLGFEQPFIREKVGFLELRQEDGDTRCFDMARGAIEVLVSKADLDWSDIDCLIVCTQNPDGYGLPNTASALHGELGLSKDCAAFDISLGCSGYVYGLSVIQGFMQVNGLRRGILVTSDPYSKIVAPEDRETATLFGDGASATLFETNASWRIGRSLFGSDGTQRQAISVDETKKLSMNGRGVFVFAAQTVPPLLKRTMEVNGVALSDVDRILVHQGSRYIVEDLRKRMDVSAEIMPFGAAQTGNTVSSSLPFLLADVFDRPVQTILLAGFGVGLSWGATLLEKHE